MVLGPALGANLLAAAKARIDTTAANTGETFGAPGQTRYAASF